MRSEGNEDGELHVEKVDVDENVVPQTLVDIRAV